MEKPRAVLKNLIISQLLNPLEYQVWFKLMLRQFNNKQMIKF